MTTYDIQKIMQYLPHRYPFLLIDRVKAVVPGEKVIALKNVTINEPFFQGHFPGVPVMPGVLILEAMGQAGGVLAYESLDKQKADNLVFLTGIDKARFRKPVVPGDQLIFELKLLKKRARVVRMSGVAKVDGVKVAEAELMAAYGDKV
ncbi:MAG: 3-hydroxyacyl-ACP dehydratase FabZ [Thermodesulfobacteriota bacterium]